MTVDNRSAWAPLDPPPSILAMDSSSGSADHLVVLVHGLWGNPTHLNYLATTLREAYSEDQLHVLVASSNANSFTYDGIELGGERITHEVEAKIKELEQDGKKITKLSIIGYSLGGLLARYAIGLLYANGWFDRIQPVNFTSFASPHLGVRTPLVGPHSYLWNVLGAHTLSTSGQQLFLIDSFRNTGRPLLSVLADPNSIFVRALASFKNRSLYTNIINDRSAVFYTTCISRTDPYVDLDAVELNPLEGTEDVILDPEDPVRPKQLPQLGIIERLGIQGRSTIKGLPFFMLLSVLLPIGSVFFLANAGYQTIRSAQRVKLHNTGQAGISLDRYRIPFIEEARHLGDRMYRNLGSEQGEDYLPTPPPEEEASAALIPKSNGAPKSNGFVKSNELKQAHDTFPTLALTDEQFEMIDNLDHVGFVKYHVHISKVRHTHAAIVQRVNRSGHEQGKIVVKHWVEHFEL